MSKTLSFFTTGKSFGNHIWTFITEGQYDKAISILKQNLDKDSIRKFFNNEYKFIGDTRKDGLYIIDNKEAFTKKQFYNKIYIGLRTLSNDNDLLKLLNSDDKDIKALLTIFEKEEIVDIVFKNEFKYQFLNALFKDLYKYKLASHFDWVDDTKCVHISVGQVTTSKFLMNDLSKEQLIELFNNKKYLIEYGTQKNIIKFLHTYLSEKYNKGGKYNNLKFIQYFFPNISLPKFSLRKIKGVKNCIRTSPNKSIPGVLNSVFDVKSDSITKLKNEFKTYLKQTGDNNKFNYFYQEYIEGYNGVAHYDGTLRYSCSPKRGNIVKGKVGTKTISRENEDILSELGRELFESFNKLIQFEFVVDRKGKLYLLQFRTLQNVDTNIFVRYKYGNILHQGKSFNKKVGYVKKKDVLIIEDECDSNDLLNKKLLIVQKDIEFSHALALSYVLKIPSIYNLNIDYKDLPDEFYVDTTQKVGLILKSSEQDGVE
jgi:hypothetical protein